MKAQRLEREFAHKNVRAGSGLLLLGADDALALVDRAADEGVPILALDGYLVADADVRPSLEHSVDFSRFVAEGHGGWQQASAFIRDRRDRVSAFSLALGSDPVEAV